VLGIVAVLEEMGRKTVSEGMRGDGFVDFGEPGGSFDGPLKISFVQVVALSDAADGVYREIGGGKDVLPGKFPVCVRVFPFESVREVDRAIAHRKVDIVLGSDLLEVEAQGFEQDVREHGDPIVLALAVADDDLAVGKVQVLDTQAHGLHTCTGMQVQVSTGVRCHT